MLTLRSILFVPTHIQRFVVSAAKSDADAIQLDLEDSVPSDQKAIARGLLNQQITLLSAQHQAIWVRVNRDLKECLADLEQAVQPNVSMITLPKVKGPEHIQLIDEQITALETQHSLPALSIGLVAMIEDIHALQRIKSIAKASPRLRGLMFGTEDLALSAGYAPNLDNLIQPHRQLIEACRLANITPLGFPDSIACYGEPKRLTQSLNAGRVLGLRMACCVHPNQIALINQIYSPTPEEWAFAEQVVKSYELAEKNGQGAVGVEGVMVDWPVYKKAQILLSRYKNQSH